MENNNNKDFIKWLSNGNYSYLPSGNQEFKFQVPPGLYEIRSDMKRGTYLYRKDYKHDSLLKLPMKEMNSILEDISTFWQSENKFKEYGFVFKRGILLYGPAGSGKTSIINLIIKDLIETQKGVVFTITDSESLSLYSSFMKTFREIQPDTPIVCILEDIDGLCSSKWLETKLLQILDGVEQLDKIVYLATTNYPEKLQARLTNRPSRFDRRYEIGLPSAESRKYYIEQKVKSQDLHKIDITKWVEKTEGMTLSHVADLIKSVLVLNMDFDSTIETLKNMIYIPTSKDFKGNMIMPIKENNYVNQESTPMEVQNEELNIEEDSFLEQEYYKKNKNNYFYFGTSE